MKVKKFTLPIREDFFFYVILAEYSDSKALSTKYGVEKEWIDGKDAFAMEMTSGDFGIVLFNKANHVIAHECSHVAFYVARKFDISDEEYHCMMVEWLFKKCIEVIG